MQNIVPVSVVIPAYRAARTIGRAVESVLNQTALPSEVLIIDDGSPDGDELAAAVRPYGEIIKLLQKSNGGASSARNFGIDHARFEWIAFLDADDYWEADKLGRQLSIAASCPEVGVIGCRWYEEIPGSVRTVSAHQTKYFCGRCLQTRGREAFEVAMTVWTGSLLVRRTALASDRFVSGLEPAEDRDLWVRLFAANVAYILPDYLATYVQEPGGISRSDIDRDCSSMLKVVYRHENLLGPAGMREQKALVHRRWASVHLFQGCPTKAFPHAVKRAWLQPFSIQAWWIVVKSLVGRLSL